MLEFWRLIFKVEKSASRERQFLRKPHSKYFAQFSGGFSRFWQGRRQFPWLSPKYFESGSLLRIFHVYTFFFWKSSQYGEILDLPVENVVKNVIIQVICVWIEHLNQLTESKLLYWNSCTWVLFKATEITFWDSVAVLRNSSREIG